ncbi:30064_t:CDS:2, partial [Gigaspora margarita]
CTSSKTPRMCVLIWVLWILKEKGLLARFYTFAVALGSLLDKSVDF